MPKQAGLTLQLNNYQAFGGQLQNLDRIIADLDRRVDRIGDSFDRLEGEEKGARREIERTADAYENSAGRMERAAQTLTSQGLRLTGAITAPFTIWKTQGVAAASAFEDALVDIQTRAGLTNEELVLVSEKALAVGRDTQFSAQQGAQAFLELLTSGQSLAEAMVTIDAVMLGGAASGEDLKLVSDALTDVMAAFQLEASQSVEVLEALSDASGSSSATFVDLVQGFQNVGGTAQQFGLSVRETAAILALFSENGIKGAEAGTQLRSMLNNMNRDVPAVTSMWNDLGISMFDLEGNARPIAELMNDLRIAIADMSDQERTQTIQTLAGTFGQLGLTALTTGGSLEEMIELMLSQGDVADIAAAKMGTLSGRMAFLRGSIETLNIKVFTPYIEKTLKPAIDLVGNLVNRTAEWVDKNPELTQTLLKIGGALAAVGPGMLIMGQVLEFMAAGSVLPFVGLLTGISALVFVIDQIQNDVGGAGVAFMELVHMLRMLAFNFGIAFRPGIELLEGFTGRIMGLFDVFRRGEGAVTPLVSALNFLRDAVFRVNNELFGFGAVDPATGERLGLAANLERRLMGLVGELDVETIKQVLGDHISEIILGAMGIAGAIIGGPRGIAIGLGGIVARAIRDDFMGIRGFLEDVGAIDAFESAKQTIMEMITQAFETAQVRGINPVVALITRFFDEAVDWLRNDGVATISFFAGQVVATIGLAMTAAIGGAIMGADAVFGDMTFASMFDSFKENVAEPFKSGAQSVLEPAGITDPIAQFFVGLAGVFTLYAGAYFASALIAQGFTAVLLGSLSKVITVALLPARLGLGALASVGSSVATAIALSIKGAFLGSATGSALSGVFAGAGGASMFAGLGAAIGGAITTALSAGIVIAAPIVLGELAIAAFSDEVSISDTVLGKIAGKISEVIAGALGLFGIELNSDVDIGMGAISRAVDDVGVIISVILDNIKRGWQRFWSEAFVTIADFIQQAQPTLEALGVGLPQDFLIEASTQRQNVNTMNIVDALTDQLRVDLRDNRVDLMSELFMVQEGGGNVFADIMASDPMMERFANAFTQQQKMVMQNAINSIASSGDLEQARFIFPLAEVLDLDTTGLGQLIGDELVAGLAQADITPAQEAGTTLMESYFDTIRSAAGIQSPSTVMMGFGRDLIYGLIIGVDMVAPLLLLRIRMISHWWTQGVHEMTMATQLLNREMQLMAQGLSTLSGVKLEINLSRTAAPVAGSALTPPISTVNTTNNTSSSNAAITVNVNGGGANVGQEVVDAINQNYRDNPQRLERLQ